LSKKAIQSFLAHPEKTIEVRKPLNQPNKKDYTKTKEISGQ
jgi:hypothetical protein